MMNKLRNLLVAISFLQLFSSVIVAEVLVDEIKLVPGKIYFVAVEDGARGKYSSTQGVRPFHLFTVSEDAGARYLSVTGSSSPESLSVNVTISKGLEDNRIELASLNQNFNYEKRAKLLQTAKPTTVKDPKIRVVPANSVSVRSFVVAVVENEIYRISIFETSSVEQMEILPASGNFPFFVWKPTVYGKE